MVLTGTGSLLVRSRELRGAPAAAYAAQAGVRAGWPADDQRGAV
jgi:hypothetical protein